MLEFVYGLFFGCFHQRTTLPMTLTSRLADGQVRRQTYVTCLNCGEELAYNWNRMKIEGRLNREVPVQLRAGARIVPAHAESHPPLLPPETRNAAAAEAANGWII
jgi:hypothetical protein